MIRNREWWKSFIADYIGWNRRTFGQTGDVRKRLDSILAHLRKEVGEVHASPRSPHEYADCVFLALDFGTRGMESGGRDWEVILFILSDVIATTLLAPPRHGIKEIIAELADPTIDPEIRGYLAFMVVRWSYATARVYGLSANDWFIALDEKLAINKCRKWPQVVNDGYVEHLNNPVRLAS